MVYRFQVLLVYNNYKRFQYGHRKVLISFAYHQGKYNHVYLFTLHMTWALHVCHSRHIKSFHLVRPRGSESAHNVEATEAVEDI